MTTGTFDKQIRDAARKHALPAGLVAAIVAVESGGNTWAWNPEPGYRYVVDARAGRPFREMSAREVASAVPPTGFTALAGDSDQEWWGQRASWGLMQVMGAVSREYGCKEPYLSRLCQPEIGLEYGCLHLASLARRCFAKSYGWYETCAAYNGGMGAVQGLKHVSNPAYPAKVLRELGGTWPEPFKL